MFWASLCPYSGEKDCLIGHMVMPGCAGCGRVELELDVPAPHDYSQHNQTSP